MTLRVAVIGAGRMGQGIALALSRSGAEVSLLGRTAKSVPAPLSVHVEGWGKACGAADVILIATPDAAIPVVAEQLLGERCIAARSSVLHLSGLLDRGAVGPLAVLARRAGGEGPLAS